MMKYRPVLWRLFLQLSTFCLFLVSCGELEMSNPGPGLVLEFRGEHESLSRVTNGGEAWTSSDEVGIFLVSAGKSLAEGVVAGADNARYRVEPEAGNALLARFTPATPGDTIYFPSGRVDALAYYPWRASLGGDRYALEIDVSSQADPGSIDVQYARRGGIDKGETEVTLAFRHVLSKVVLEVKAGPGVDGSVVGDAGKTRASITGVAGAATLSLSDGTLTSGELFAGEIPLYREVAVAGRDARFSAILVPGAGVPGRVVKFPVDGCSSSCEIPADMAFAGGTCYTFEVTIEDGGVTIGTASITPWEDPGSPVVDFVGETGIYTAADLVEFSADWSAAGDYVARREVIKKWSGTPDGEVCLRADIDMAGVGNFTPIGAWNNGFTGVFNGRGHVISNLKVSVDGDYAGLFGYNDGGTIREVVLERCVLEASGTRSGGIAGNNNGTITGCILTNVTVRVGDFGGGICGYHSGKLLTGCILTNVTVEANGYYSGGISGFVTTEGIIESCKVTGGTVTAELVVGGIGGFVYGTIKDCSVTDVTVKAGKQTAGGIGGHLYNQGVITGCIVTNGSVMAGKYDAGGICGVVAGTVGGCIATGMSVLVATGEDAGGIAGRVDGGTIAGCIAAPVDVKGVYGGVCVGYKQKGWITVCYGLKIYKLLNVGKGLEGTDCRSFDANTVGAPDYYFTTPDAGETPIERMNKVLAGIEGLDVKWTAGNAGSGWYPVCKAKN